MPAAPLLTDVEERLVEHVHDGLLLDLSREDNNKIVTSKVFTVPASIPAGASSSTFAFVSDPVTVPFTREEANEDYMVVVGIAKK